MKDVKIRKSFVTIFDLKNRSCTSLFPDISKREGAKEEHSEPSQESKMELFVKIVTKAAIRGAL